MRKNVISLQFFAKNIWMPLFVEAAVPSLHIFDNGHVTYCTSETVYGHFITRQLLTA